MCDAPLPEPLDELTIKGIPADPLARLPRGAGVQGAAQPAERRRAGAGAEQQRGGHQHGRRADRPGARAPAEPEKIEVDRSLYETVTDEAALDRWIAEATALGQVAIDTETDCIDCVVARLVGISLATAPNRACYIPVGHVGADLYSDAPRQMPMGLVLRALEAAARGPGGAQDRPQFQI